MEVLQVQAVAINLIQTGPIKLVRTEFILDDEDHPIKDDDQIGTPPHARDEELHKEVSARKLHREFTKMLDLILPSRTLCRFNRKRQLLGKQTEQIAVTESFNASGIERQVGTIHRQASAARSATLGKGDFRCTPSSYRDAPVLDS